MSTLGALVSEARVAFKATNHLDLAGREKALTALFSECASAHA